MSASNDRRTDRLMAARSVPHFRFYQRNVKPLARCRSYLKTLRDGSKSGLLDLSLLQTDKYERGLRQAVSRLWAGGDPKAILDQTAAEWDAITEEIGVARQKAVYLDWVSKPGAYPTM
ncbi:MAG: hypothetical protein U1E67_21625 [Hyphomicrobiales bacterium]